MVTVPVELATVILLHSINIIPQIQVGIITVRTAVQFLIQPPITQVRIMVAKQTQHQVLKQMVRLVALTSPQMSQTLVPLEVILLLANPIRTTTVLGIPRQTLLHQAVLAILQTHITALRATQAVIQTTLIKETPVRIILSTELEMEQLNG